MFRFFQNPGGRKFKLTIEDTVFNDVDIVALGGGSRYKSVSLETVAIIADGMLTIKVGDANPKVDQGKISAIEVKLVGPHLAHSVANGPYRAVDVTGSGTATLMVDGTPSHTHGTGMTLTGFLWKTGATILGTQAAQAITLPVGDHSITLTVTDSGGNENTEATTVKILPFGYPAVLSISPTSGSIAGGSLVTIKGSGFTAAAAETTVHFGLVKLSGSAITVVDAKTITLIAPPTVVGAPVAVSVETPLETSNSVSFNYLASVPIHFQSSLLFGIDSPTVVKFGPDRNLYIGTIQGNLARVTLNEHYTQPIGSVVASVAKFRSIQGIAFDPLDTKPIPDVYITTSFYFHGSNTSSSGQSINGNVKKISGANFEKITEVISGLPVSDHDHGITNIEFGYNGEVYFGIGSNTNGG
jgi:IPT/TIG domain